jgi:hypothetical protein
MDLTDIQPLAAAAEPTTPQPSEPPQYEQCETCAAPLDDNQRYCVVCGTRHKLAVDPAARLLATATSRARSASATAPAAGRPAARRRRSPGLGTAVVLAVIPLAVGVGVVVGRSGNGADSKLIAALRAQKPEVVTVGGGAATGTPVADSTASSSTASALTSTFSLTQGYAIELKTLPKGTNQSKVAAAEKAARAKGASAVGLISQSDFTVKPSPAQGAYVIYSGQYPSSSAANAALAKLKHAFPSATVISVKSAASGGASKVVANGKYGAVHQLAPSAPTSASLAQGKQIVNREAHQQSQSYVNSQKHLPDVIQVP